MAVAGLPARAVHTPPAGVKPVRLTVVAGAQMLTSDPAFGLVHTAQGCTVTATVSAQPLTV